MKRGRKSKKINNIFGLSSASNDLQIRLSGRERQEDLAECISGGSLKKPSDDNAASAKIVPPIYEGKTFERNSFKYMAADDIYRYEFQDFTLFTNKKCETFTDISIKEEISATRWLYAVHLNCGLLANEITPNSLNARVRGGTILAYKYLECRVNGNDGCYYGIVPVRYETNIVADTRCRFSLQEIYPRKLYVEFCAVTDANGQCDKHPNCQMWRSRSILTGCDSSASEQHLTFCTRSVPWNKLYITMGEKDENCTESTREVRDCRVCAQCYRCNIGSDYCYRHRVCRHKQAIYHSGNTIDIDDCINVKIRRKSIKK